MKKIVKHESSEIVKQHNVITAARYDMTALEKNIMYMLLAQLQDSDPIKKIYKIRIIELEKIIKTELKYKHLEDAVTRLGKRAYTLIENEKEIQIGLLTFGKYKKGTGTVELELSDDLHTYFFKLKNNFTIFNLHIALRLKSTYSKRMYEMLSQFKNTGIFRTSVQELKERLELIDTKTGKEKYENFKDFNKNVLLIAKNELNEVDINFTYTTKKTGKKITDLEFKINYKPSSESKNLIHTLPEAKLLSTPSNQPISKVENTYEKLPPEELRLYKKLGKEVGIKSKALCLAIVKNIPSVRLERNINQFLEDTKFGKNTITATVYFKNLLDKDTHKEEKETFNKFMHPSKDEQAEIVWNKCLEYIRAQVHPESFKTWFKPITPIKFEHDTLMIQVPSEFFYEMLETKYLPLLTQAITQEIGPEGKLEYAIPRQ